MRGRIALCLGALVLVSGCLVTNELEFEQNRNPALILRALPDEPYARVKALGDPECEQVLPDSVSMEFRALYYDLDLNQNLYVRPFVNGATYGEYRTVLPSGMPYRSLDRAICVPVETLSSQACNRVQIFVSDDPRKIADPLLTNVTRDPDIATLDWLVLGSSTSQPEAQFSDCLFEPLEDVP